MKLVSGCDCVWTSNNKIFSHRTPFMFRKINLWLKNMWNNVIVNDTYPFPPIWTQNLGSECQESLTCSLATSPLLRQVITGESAVRRTASLVGLLVEPVAASVCLSSGSQWGDVLFLFAQKVQPSSKSSWFGSSLAERDGVCIMSHSTTLCAYGSSKYR